MSFGVLLLCTVLLAQIWFIISALRDAHQQESKRTTTPKYNNYDAPFRTEQEAFIPYDSYEFAGVKGPERQKLQREREALLNTLTDTATAQGIHNLIVLSEEIIEKNNVHAFPEMRMTPLTGAVVTLSDGRRYLCTIDNVHLITAVEGVPDGIPFGLEDISSISHTKHFVTLSLMEKRWNSLQLLNLHITSFRHLAPGNY